MQLKKMIYIVLGCIGTVLGAVGAIIPLLPTIPFLMLAAFCFGKSSQRLHHWFMGTQLYQNYLSSYIKGAGMAGKTKLRIILVVSATMTVGFLLMGRVPIGRVILVVVWVAHILYFVFGVKNLAPSFHPELESPKSLQIPRRP